MASTFLNTAVAPQTMAQVSQNPTQMTATQGMPVGYQSADINVFGQPSASNVPITSSGTASGSGGASPSLDSILGSTLGTAANIWGGQNAAEAATNANLNAINTQNTTMGNISNVYSGQSALGNGAFSALGSALGTNGQPANYSNFLNMPGYQFAVDQGTQAIQRAATAQGSAYTPNTLTDIGKYVTGTAMGDYNQYVQQLMGAAGLGAQANQGTASAFLNTGANISQLQANIGQNQAGAATSTGSALGSFLGGTNGTGVIGQIGSTVGKTIGNGISNYLGGAFTADPAITGAAGAQDAASTASGWAASNTDAADLASASNQQWLDSLGGAGGSGAAAAGTAAPELASVGTDAATADVSIAGLGGADAAGGAAAAGDVAMAPVGVDAATADAGVTGLSGGSEAGGGLSAGMGAAAALLPLGITAELAMHTGAVQLGQDYWNKYNNPTGSYGSSTGNYTQNFLELANGINQGDIPPASLLAQYPGLYAAAANMKSLQSAPMSNYWGTGGSTAPRSQNRA